MFDSEPLAFEGEKLKIVSPKSMIQTLLYYYQLGLSELREKDRVRAISLIQKYFPGQTIDSSDFHVRVEEL